jgi:hypothetical protein
VTAAIASDAEIVAAALACIKAGISIVPIDHRTKRPAMHLLPTGEDGKPTWKPYQSQIADEATVRSWFERGCKAFAVVCGDVSGGLLVLDFDEPRFYEAWRVSVGARADGIPIQQTGGGGFQALMLCTGPGGNDKLAWMPDEREDAGRAIAIETRGGGGYAVVPPSLHPSGNIYKMLVGSLTAIPAVEQSLADALVDAARNLDEAPHTRQELERIEVEARAEHRRQHARRNGQASVIDAFNDAHAIEAILEQHGYPRITDGRFKRPGGKSPSVHVKDGKSCHFSSNDPLCDGRVKSGIGVHDSFDVWAYFNHGGNVSAAVKSAAELLGLSSVNSNQHQQVDAESEPIPETISAGELCESFKELKPTVIDELLRETETANYVSTSKANKTHAAIDLSLCIATGRMWLDRFVVSQGCVLYIDAELHRQTFAHRLAKVARARGILTDEFRGKIDVLPLRGNLKDLMALGPFFRRIPKGKYKAVVIDALYRLIPRGFDENSNADITAIYNRVDQYAELIGAAIICVHHATKGNQSGKSVIDIGSGAGAQARAVDSHITLRPHQEDNCVVMEAALRSFPPLPAMGLRWEYPVWKLDPTLDVDSLREPGQRRQKADEPDWTAESFAAAFVAPDPKAKSSILVAAGKRGIKQHRAALLLSAAVDCGAAHEWSTKDRRTQHKFSTLAQPAPALEPEGKKP